MGSAGIVVTHFRLTCLWVEGIPKLLGADDVGPLGSLVNPDAYARRFEALLDAQNEPLCVLPWRAKAGQVFPERNHFWNRYLLQELRSRAEPGYVAWRAATPLRQRQPAATIARGDRTFVDGWYYPHGVALTVTAWFRGEYDAASLPSAVTDFRYKPLAATVDGRPQAGNALLNDIAASALAALRARAFGDVEKSGSSDPIVILSIISARDGAPAAEASQAIAAATLRAAGDPPAAGVTLSRDVYTFSRGNVVWAHDKAVDAQKPHALGCLHANLTMARLQVESLLECAALLSGALDDTKRCLPARIFPYAMSVGRLLGRLYGGARTYAAPFVRARIDEANKRGDIDEFLHKLELPKLRAAAPK